MIKAAGIVTYEPDYFRLKLSLEKLLNQAELIIIIDNSASEINIDYICEEQKEKVLVHKNRVNLGLGRALSQLCDIALSYHIDWLLLLDQDSIISDSFFDNYIEHLGMTDVGMLCPIVVEDRFNLKQLHTVIGNHESSNVCEVASAITSGSYINLSIQKELGFFEDLFVDGIDNDYSYRLRAQGYKIYCISDNVLLHEFGDSSIVFLTHFAKLFTGSFHPALIRRNHSPKRIYFQIRNTIILHRKWKKYPNINVSGKLVRSIISFTLKILLVENRKILKLYNLILGIVSGFKYKLKED